MKSPILQQIKLNAIDMAMEESRSSVCPFCDGGPTHERSFSTTRTREGILYHCFRVKCHESGFIPATPGDAKPRAGKQYRHFTRPLRNLSHGTICWLYNKYGLEKNDIELARWKDDYTRGRLYMPIIDEHGFECGAVSKRLSTSVGLSGPKVLIYFWAEDYRLHVAPSEVDGGPLVVVEDIISATKVARQARCCAILGTSLSVDVAKRLRLLSTSITVALDADTWRNSSSIGYKFKQKYGLMFENFRVIKLSKDPKFMTDREIKEIILGDGT